jgi:hypothetical protein
MREPTADETRDLIRRATQCRDRIYVYDQVHRYAGPVHAYDALVNSRTRFTLPLSLHPVHELKHTVRYLRDRGVDVRATLRRAFEPRVIRRSRYFVFLYPIAARAHAKNVCALARSGK